MKTTTWLLGLLVAAAWISAADHVLAQAPENSSAASGDVNLVQSRVYIRVGKTGLGHEHGVVGNLKSGSLKLGAKSSAGQFVFDMTSFAADTDEARKYVGLQGSTASGPRKQVDQNMLGPDVLNVKQYPTATFVIDSAQAAGKTSSTHKPVYVLKGKFTLHGKTRPLSINVVTEDSEGSVHVKGDFSILQSEYGMKPYTAALGTVGVADKLTIWGDLFVAK